MAAIAAAYFPPSEHGNCDLRCTGLMADGANENGIAPGAQIVSIKIADTHLGGMETNTSLLAAVCFLVDMSGN